MDSQDLLSTLVMISEKAANIARICRHDTRLLSLLVEEKKESEKNPRFVRDFKTLADVLVQEVVKHEVGRKFPILSGQVYGEENNEFTSNGEKIVVEIKSEKVETEKLLLKALCDQDAAAILAKEVHREMTRFNLFSGVDMALPEFPKNIGIWVDPIDSTAEYINGEYKKKGNLFSGLPCVTVLIGVFDRDNGSPIAGVINQPFYTLSDTQWTGRQIYGISFGHCKITYPVFEVDDDKMVAVSSSESDEVKEKLVSNGYNLAEVPGAGYKLLSIITGEACGYVLSKPTTFLWDLCACHAILESIGGGILNFSTLEPIQYKGGKGVEECCNKGGILAYRNEKIKRDLIQTLYARR